MSNFVTDPPDDAPLPLLEEHNNPEHSEETRPSEMDPLDDSLLPLSEEQSNLKHSEDPEESGASEMQQVVITSMCN